jgi:UDP-2,4-diacetamido-2,4,6-trideoxy-beta-L-altropyranose hydrolase
MAVSEDTQRQDALDTLECLFQYRKRIDWVIVDHYGLGQEWQCQLRPIASRIMVIDDLANRHHDCDLLLDQNFADEGRDRYSSLVPDHCRLLLGPQYALLRDEFLKAREPATERDGSIGRILVFFGGIDSPNFTRTALEAIARLGQRDFLVDVIIGRHNPHRQEVSNICDAMRNTTFSCDVNDMAERMARADLAIGAGGTTTWERCVVGLPAIIVSLAKNQVAVAKEAQRLGAARYLGSFDHVSAKQIAQEIEGFLKKPRELRKMGQAAAALLDGGGVQRVTSALFEHRSAGTDQ